MKTKLSLEIELEPWQFGYFTQAAGELECSVPQAIQEFFRSDPAGDALCQFVSSDLQPNTAANRFN